MKRFLTLLFTAFAFVTTFAQTGVIQEPVKWTAKVEKSSDTEYTLTLNATIEEHWHMYSQHSDEMGSLPMVVTFENATNNYTLVGETEESETEQAFNDVFGVTETFWNQKAQLTQKIKTTDNTSNIVQMSVDYQACKDMCINDKKLFQFDLKNLTVSEVKVFEEVPLKKKDGKGEVAVSKQNNEDKSDPWTIFFGTLLAGLLVTFTPCVFPMIPMTVSFFIKQNSNAAKGKFNAIFYGICIVAIYVLLSVPFHIFEGIDRNIFADISTNVYLNLFFFLVFIIFAISFFGAFEITMPNSLASKADNASNAGGLMGIFFMALTLIIVSFSCTGPALGFVFGTVLSSDGGAMLVSLAMFGFGLGLAFPFMIFALFPSLMTNLPKSGGWLNTVKVVFGFIELALAFKFLSNADLVLQLHLLPREVFIAIWVAVFGALSLYLFGKFSMPHDSPVPFLSVGRMLLGVFALFFTVYLIPGLWGAPLKIMSGVLPPLTYSEAPMGFGGSGAPNAVTNGDLPEGAKVSVHGIVAFEDYDKGLAYAKEVNKPVMLDFTGHVCTNCRNMEENVWVDPQVLTILKNDVVLISLYCDERIDLPKEEQFISEYTGKKIATVGEKWSDFQLGRFHTNARPYYVLLNTDGEEFEGIEPVAYTPDVQEYLAWLQSGLEKFNK